MASSAAASHPTVDCALEEVKVSGLTNRRPAQNSSQDNDDVTWTGPVEWVRNLRERSITGMDVGNHLYAGKKRMFKGHNGSICMNGVSLILCGDRAGESSIGHFQFALTIFLTDISPL
jgi:hypothetical protein